MGAVIHLHRRPIGPALSEDQHEALDTLLGALRRGQEELVLVGAAGTGKTTVMRSLLASVRGRLTYLACPTWKAALRLSEVTGHPAVSIHRLIYGPPLEKPKPVEKAKTATARPEEDEEEDLVFHLDPDNIYGKLPRGSLVVVDEASMVNERVHADLMRVARVNACQVLWVGDREQLEPVRGTWGPDLANPTAALTTVHRQAAGSSVLGLATAIRENRIRRFEGYDAKCRWEKRFTDRDVTDFFRETFGAGDAAAVALTYTNKERRRLNRLARRALGLTGVALRPGEPLLSFANKGGLVNGEVVHVVSVMPQAPPLLADTEVNAWTVRISQGGIVREVYVCPDSLCPTDKGKNERTKALYEELDKVRDRLRDPWSWGDTLDSQATLKREAGRIVEVEHGYASTVHKAQGSQWPHVLVVVDGAFRNAIEREGADFARRWLYTAATRAEERLIIGSVGKR